MNNKNIVLAAFILVALAQLYVPTKMIWDREDVLNTGMEYKFKAAPFHSKGPFRGKYITLDYAEDKIAVPNEQDWISGEPVYISLTIDNDGFAKIKSIAKTQPIDNQNHIKAKVGHITRNGSNMLTVDYPFDKYSMGESNTYRAGYTYPKSQRDSSEIIYALVTIKNGEAVLKDVLANGISLREIVKVNQEGNNE